MTASRFASRYAVWNFLVLGSVMLVGCGQASTSGESATPPTTGTAAATATNAQPAADSSTVAKAPATAPAPTTVAKSPTKTAKPATKSPAARKPASLQDATQILNLAELPAPPGAEFSERSAADAMVNVPLKLADAFQFYVDALTKRGWKEETEGNYRQVAEQYAQTMFAKDDFQVSLFASPAGDKGDSSQVMLRNLGNVDTRALPAPAGSQVLYGSPGSTIYTTDLSVLKAAEACRADLIKAGWLEYGPVASARADNDEQQFLTFRQGGIELSVMVNLAPAQGNKTSIHYGCTLLDGELPWPADAQAVEFDAGRMYLAFKSPQDLKQLVDYYQKQLAEMAWSNRSDFQQINEKSASLYFDDANRNRLMVHIDAHKDEAARHVSIERLTAAQVDAIAEEARKNELAAQEASKPASETSTEEPTETAKSQVAARELKLPKNAKGVAYDASGSEITFTSVDTPTKVTEFFRDQLVGETWKEDRRFSVVSDDASVFEFQGGGDTRLSFTLIRFPDADGTRVTISGNGLSWGDSTGDAPAQVAADATDSPAEEPAADTPPASADEELVAEDKDGYPVPSGYSSFSTESTPFRKTVSVSKAAPLAKIAEFYRSELPKLGWKELKEGSLIEAESATMKFTGDQGALIVKLSRANDETQVELATRSQDAAKKAGILPKPGKARMIFGNTLKSNVSLTIDGKNIKLKPGEGEKKPDGPSLDLEPGKYKLTVTIDGKTTSDDVEVDADQTWGVVVIEPGALPLLMY